MTSDELRAARAALGEQRGLGRPLTQRELCKELGMGKWGWQAMSRWENGKTPIPGPTQVAIQSLLGRAK